MAIPDNDLTDYKTSLPQENRMRRTAQSATLGSIPLIVAVILVILPLMACGKPDPPASVRLGEKFTLPYQSKTTVGKALEIRFVKVEDSRCPVDVNCFWAGNGKVMLEVSQPGVSTPSTTIELDTNKAVGPSSRTFAGFTITLHDLEPKPKTPRPNPEKYSAVLTVTRE